MKAPLFGALMLNKMAAASHWSLFLLSFLALSTFVDPFHAYGPADGGA